MDLSGKNIVLGVTGGIAAYKSCGLVSLFKKAGAEVNVIMSSNATQFVTPLTFETLSKNRVITDMFDRDFPWEVEHISIAKKADIFVVAPCTADFIGKYANGIADDFITTAAMSMNCPVVLAPAMNTRMLESFSCRENILRLKTRGVIFVESGNGMLACGDVGKGRMAEPEETFSAVVKVLNPRNDFSGKTVIVTAGATKEYIDPVRYITNRSSGKMGAAIASAARKRGAKVIFIYGNISVPLPDGVEALNADTTEDMFNCVMQNLYRADIIVKAAAPADYAVEAKAEQKLKSYNLTLKLAKTADIAAAAGKVKDSRKLIIFSAETENLTDNARKKLIKKNADMVIANDVTQKGAGFEGDTNIVTIITKDNSESLPLMTKTELADVILDKIAELK